MNITNKEDFKKLTNELYDIYRKYYGVIESVRKFFEEYVDRRDQEKIIKSLVVGKYLFNWDNPENEEDKKRLIEFLNDKGMELAENAEIKKINKTTILLTDNKNSVIFNIRKCFDSYSMSVKYSDNIMDNIEYPGVFSLEEDNNGKKRVYGKNESLRKKISVLYDVFRNRPIHSGVRISFPRKRDENVINLGLHMQYNGNWIRINLFFEDLHEIVKRGFRQYYEKELNVEHNKENEKQNQ